MEKADSKSKGKEWIILDCITYRPFSCWRRCLPLGVLRPVRNPLIMPLSNPEVKAHYNDSPSRSSAPRWTEPHYRLMLARHGGTSMPPGIPRSWRCALSFPTKPTWIGATL